MTNKNTSKDKKKRKGYIFRFILIVFVVYVSASVINTQLEITELEQKLSVRREILEAEKIKSAELDELLNSDEKNLIEQTARDKLGLVYPDERVYIDIS